MPLYEYKAVELGGKRVSGVVHADNSNQLVIKLREQGRFVLSCNEKKSSHSRFKLTIKELTEYCRQLGTMLTSGVSLVRALDIIREGDMRSATRRIYDNLISSVRQGVSLSTAMRDQNGAFPELLVNMFIAGESSGSLGKTAIKMANHYENEHRLNSKVENAMTYPVILIVITVAVVLVVFTVVLPYFFELFEGMDLPAITRGMLWISKALTKNFVEFSVIVGAIVTAVVIITQIAAVRYRLDKFKLRIPKIGKLMMTIYTARFARTLASLYLSGMSLLDALEVSRDTIGNKYLERQFDDVITDVRRGETLSVAVLKVDGFDIKLSATIMIGEESGKLDIMLASIADAYEYDAEAATQRLTTLMEPIMIVIMALIIGTIMISVMMPIYQYYQTLGA